MKPYFALTALTLALAACGGGGTTAPASLVAQPVKDDNPFTVVPGQPVSTPDVARAPSVPDPVVDEPIAEPVPVVEQPAEPTPEPVVVQAPVVEPDPEPDTVVVDEPEVDPAIDMINDLEYIVESPMYEINNPDNPTEPDRDNNGVAYIDKPITQATYSLRYEFSTQAECPTALPCEPWIYTFIDFDLFWYDVEQGVSYRVWKNGQFRHSVTEAEQPPVHEGHRYTFALKLREPDVLAVVAEQVYQVDALEFRGLSSGLTPVLTWTEAPL